MKIIQKVKNQYRRFLKKKVILNYKTYCKDKKGHALLYFKTDPLCFPSVAHEYTHTNNWEILEMVKILNERGYWVDVVDREIGKNEFIPEDKYDLFIGLGAGNSGKHYYDYARKLSRAKKVLFAAGPEPNLSNSLIRKRYDYYNLRHPGKTLKLRRMIDQVDVEKFMSCTDAIFCIGNRFSVKSYEKHGKKIFPLVPSVSPELGFEDGDVKKRSRGHFLYLGGSGHVVKGLDLLLETFSQLPDLTLTVCAPADELDFNAFYQKLLFQTKNISFKGFVSVGSTQFREITEECGFILLPSCSEGIATSGVTGIRRGLIPVMTYEAGLDAEDYGVLMEKIEIEYLKDLIVRLSKMPLEEFHLKMRKAHMASEKFTQEAFSRTFDDALAGALQMSGRGIN